MNTRDRLKHIGLSLFARHGYEGTSLSQIADAAGIKKPSIYNHFESKAALFLELASDAENDILALVEASLAQHAQAPYAERLRHLVESCCAFSYREHQGVFYKRFLLFPPQELSAQAEAITRRGETLLDERLTRFFEQGRQSGVLRNELTARQFNAALYCLVDGLLSETFMYERDELNQRFEGVWSVFWAGVKAGG